MNKLTLAVCPRRPILPHVEELTGLSNYNLEHQAAWTDGVGAAVAAFLTLLARPVCLVAHNGFRFDYPLLKRELQNVRYWYRYLFVLENFSVQLSVVLYSIPDLKPQVEAYR